MAGTQTGRTDDRTPTPASLRHRLGTWLLLTGDRLVVAGLVLVSVVVAGVALDAAGLFTYAPTSASYFLFSSLLGGNLTLVTVVLSINQLVLSRELGDPGNLQSRIEGAMSYRREVEAEAGVATSPVEPGEFLRFLHEHLRDQAGQVENSIDESVTPELWERVGELVASIQHDAERVNETLTEEGDIFTVLAATMQTNHSEQLRELAAVQANSAETITDEQRELLDGLQDRLLQIDVARKYFETVYVQRELSYLSRLLLYVGLPAMVLAAAVLLGQAAVTTTPTPSQALSMLVPVAILTGFAPIAVLFSFVIRLSWVAQETATVAPFTVGDGN